MIIGKYIYQGYSIRHYSWSFLNDFGFNLDVWMSMFSFVSSANFDKSDENYD